jgi:hypothetical protein
MLSSYLDTQGMNNVVASVFALHEERLIAAAGLDVHAGKDMIVNIPNIILAFAGKVPSAPHECSSRSELLLRRCFSTRHPSFWNVATATALLAKMALARQRC